MSASCSEAVQSPVQDMVWIACPLGCRLSVGRSSLGSEVSVTGNRCPKGELYAQEELLSPKRIVTAVVRTDSADYPCAPVRTDRPLPRERTRELLAELGRMRVALPVAAGTELLADWDGGRG